MSGLSEVHPNIKSESRAAGKRKKAPEEDLEDTDDGEVMEIDITKDTDSAGAGPSGANQARDDEDDDCVFAGRSGDLALADVSPPPPASPLLPRSHAPRPPAVPARARELRREAVGEWRLQGQRDVLRQLLLLRVRHPVERVQGLGVARPGHAHSLHVARQACRGQGCSQGGRSGQRILGVVA